MGGKRLALSLFLNNGVESNEEDRLTSLSFVFSSFPFSVSLSLSSPEDPGDIGTGIVDLLIVGAVDSELIENMDNGEALCVRSMLDPSI
jgi:hypothetical protein